MANRREFLKGAGAGLVTASGPGWAWEAVTLGMAGRASAGAVGAGLGLAASGVARAASPLNIPERVLVALSTADPGRGIPTNMKHVASAFHPPSGKIYFTGGDHASPGYPNSYRQETFALDVAARYANRTDRNAGWSIEYPYAGYGGNSVQPKHPDTVSFTWDSNRGAFWMCSGLMEGNNNFVQPAGETNSNASDSNFIYYKAMTFDPAAAPASRWRNTGFDWARNTDGSVPWTVTGQAYHRHAVHDPVNDVVLVPCSQQDGSNLAVLHCATGIWTYHNLNGWGGYRGVQRGNHLAADFSTRRIYHVASTGPNYPDGTNTAHLVSFAMDSPYTSRDHGPVPAQPTADAYQASFVTWDSVNQVLIYIPWTVPDTDPPNEAWSTTEWIKFIYAYHPATSQWETIPVVTSPLSTLFVLASACFDPVNNVHVFIGGTSTPSTNFFLFRYKSLPKWLDGQPLNQWVPIAGTELRDSDVSAQIAAGLGGGAFGRPNKGIFDWGGGALKTSTSELLVMGGGGAGAWAGNDVRSLKLSDDVPRWKTVVKPSPSTAVWPRNAVGADFVPHSRMKDGTPNARHSSREPAFIDSLDQFMLFGCQQVWETDSGIFSDVDSVRLSIGVWNPPKTHPDLPFAASGPPGWAVKHPDTEAVYVASYDRIWKWSPATNTWSIVYDGSAKGLNYLSLGPADIDPIRNILLQIGIQSEGNPWRAAAIDLNHGTLATGELVGPCAGNILAVQNRNSGFVFDRGLGKFLLYQDDGSIYTLAPAKTGSDWYVDKLPLTGAPPAAGAFANHSGIWSRMQYVPALGGIVLATSYDQPAYFIRTGYAGPSAPPPPPPPPGGNIAPKGVSVTQNPAGAVTAGTLVTLTASCAAGTAPINYRWSTGQTGAQMIFNATTSSSFTVTASNAAGSATGGISVVVTASPPGSPPVAPANCTITQSPPGNAAAGTMVTLTANCAAGTAPISYQWSTGATGAQITVTPTATTTYSVTASNAAGSTQASATIAIGTTGPTSVKNYEGLWWAAPAGVESGWGINLSHQGNVIFATWFTYNAAGNPYWLTMVAQSSNGVDPVFTGDLYETQGPAFNAAQFDPQKVSRKRVGTGRLEFADAENGSFSYAIGSVSQTKPITREVFATPAPQCKFDSAANLPKAKNFQGLWWAAPQGSESGWGVNLSHQGDTIFVTWFTYGFDGAPMWLSATIKLNGNGGTGTLYSTTGPAYSAPRFDPGFVTRTPTGTLTLTFSDGNTGTFSYVVAGVARSKSITRQVFATPVSLCA